jgi:hypothetical protein
MKRPYEMARQRAGFNSPRCWLVQNGTVSSNQRVSELRVAEIADTDPPYEARHAPKLLRGIGNRRQETHGFAQNLYY